MTAQFLAADNVPDCAWQAEGDDLETLYESVWDHIFDEHPAEFRAPFAIYTHSPCGQTRETQISMQYHADARLCGRAVAEVGHE